MLKFLTHKLRTHSLNEEISEKVENFDSGTESDDEIDRTDSIMKECSVQGHSPASTHLRPSIRAVRSQSGPTSPVPQNILLPNSPSLLAPVIDLQYDQHSSEEELEVINSTPKEIFRKYIGNSSNLGGSTVRATRNSRATRPASAVPPEKRKWSQCQSADADRLASPFSATLTVAENDENAAFNSAGAEHHSSDEEVLRSPDALPAPVRFRTSPPIEALKPRRSEGPRIRGAPLTTLGGRSCSCRPIGPRSPQTPESPASGELFHYEVSPRKRSRHSSRKHIQRPCLDFDKMQQLKVRAVTTWRHGGAEHGGELSVFCW